MKTFLSILLIMCCGCLMGCSSMFHDPLLADYRSGKISKGEYEQLTQERQESLARTSPAYWELQQTIAQNHDELNP